MYKKRTLEPVQNSHEAIICHYSVDGYKEYNALQLCIEYFKKKKSNVSKLEEALTEYNIEVNLLDLIED